MKINKSMLTLALLGSMTSASVLAANSGSDQQEWKDVANDAWIDGKAEATLLFNGNLNNFDIDTDVKEGVVILTGQVDSSVDKKLAGELVKGIKGVKSVDNKLMVVNKNSSDDSTVKQTVMDSKIATVVKTSLLLDPDVNGSDIDVDVENNVVVLEGTAESSSMKDLAIMLAKNTDDVTKVIDKIDVVTQ